MGAPEHRYLRWAAGGAVALLLGCGGLASCWFFGSTADPVPAPTPGTPSPSSSLSVELSPSPEASATLYFKTCTDAIRAGVPLPVRSNEPGYRLELDGDEDGKACE